MGSAIVSALVNVIAKNPSLLESLAEGVLQLVLGVLQLVLKEVQAKAAKA